MTETTNLREELEAIRAEMKSIPTDPQERTGADWRLLAKEAALTSAESFERCDSDGFLSQWANQQMQFRYLDNAKIADAGHVAEAPAIFDLDGNLLSMKRGTNDWGKDYWVVDTDEGRSFLNESNAQKLVTARRNNEKKGFRFGWVKVRVQMKRTDHYLTDEVVSVKTTDWYGDMIADGKTTIFD